MDPCPPLFLGFWLGWLGNSVCLNTHFLQNLHPESDLWFLTYGRMPTITRRIRTVPFKVISARFLIFPSWTATAPEGFSFRRTFSVILCLRSWSRIGQSCLISTLDVVVAETASISCWPLSFCFPLIANSFSSFNATWSSPVFLSTMTFPFWSDQYSCFNSLISGLKIPCFDHLTFLSASRDVDQFLVRTLPMLFWVDQTLVFASYELSRILSLGTSLVDNKTWSHPVPNLEYRRHVKWYWIDLKNQEQLQVSPTPVDFWKNAILRQSSPRDRERGCRPCADQHPKKELQILLNCERPKFVSHTSNLFEQCSTSEDTQKSPRGWFRFFHVASRVWVL